MNFHTASNAFKGAWDEKVGVLALSCDHEAHLEHFLIIDVGFETWCVFAFSHGNLWSNEFMWTDGPKQCVSFLPEATRHGKSICHDPQFNEGQSTRHDTSSDMLNVYV